MSWQAVAAESAVALCLMWALLGPVSARADWVEPVFGPVNQTNAFASGIRGNGSEALVGLTQIGATRPGGSFPVSLQVGSPRSSSWQLSPPLNRSTTMQVASLRAAIFTPSGPVYATWAEQPVFNGPYEVYLDRYLGGGMWTPIGGSLNHNETQTADVASSPTVANVDGAPWVAWQEGLNYPIWVARIAGNQPSYVGAPISTGGAPASPSLVGINGVPYLAFNRYDGVHVATFARGRWSELRGLSAPGNSPTITSVAGRIWLAWTQHDANGHLQLHAARYVGNGHWFASQSLNIDPNEDARDAQITSVGDVPWLVWTESSRPYADNRILNHVFVKQFNGTTWNQVGGPLNVDVNQSASAGGISDVAGNAWVDMTQSQTDGGSAVRVKEAVGFEPHVLSLRTFRAHRHTTGGARATRFQIVLSEPGTIRLDFTQTVKGRRDGGICVPATRRNARRRACPLAVSRGHVSFRGSAGANAVVFGGTLSNHRRLKKGVYTVLISATSATGLRSASQAVRVTV